MEVEWFLRTRFSTFLSRKVEPKNLNEVLLLGASQENRLPNGRRVVF